LRETKIIPMKREYANALTYIDMFHWSACWRTVSEARQVYNKLTSVTAQKEAVKENIRIRVIGFGWDDLYHPWFKDRVDYPPGQLRDHLINTIIPDQS